MVSSMLATTTTTTTVHKIIGIMIGLLLAYIVGIACNTRNYIMYSIPKPSTIQQNIYKSKDKCYRLKTEETTCTIDNK